jgi:hypothetical protein
LSFSAVRGDRIDEGVKRLGEVIREAMKRPAPPPLLERAALPLV